MPRHDAILNPPPGSPTATPGGPTPCPIQFTDVSATSTFYDFIRCLACRGIVGGYPCGGPSEPCPGPYFRPFNNATRDQMSKIAAAAFFPNCQTPTVVLGDS